MTNLRFFWNGIKAGKGNLQLAYYSAGGLIHHPAGTITIYARAYKPFSAEVREAFTVENDSDPVSDYSVKDHIRVRPDHPLHGAIKAAMDARAAHAAKRAAKRTAKKNAAA